MPDIDSPRELFEWVSGKTLEDNCDESAVNLLAKVFILNQNILYFILMNLLTFSDC